MSVFSFTTALLSLTWLISCGLEPCLKFCGFRGCQLTEGTCPAGGRAVREGGWAGCARLEPQRAAAPFAPGVPNRGRGQTDTGAGNGRWPLLPLERPEEKTPSLGLETASLQLPLSALSPLSLRARHHEGQRGCSGSSGTTRAKANSHTSHTETHTNSHIPRSDTHTNSHTPHTNSYTPLTDTHTHNSQTHTHCSHRHIN